MNVFIQLVSNLISESLGSTRRSTSKAMLSALLTIVNTSGLTNFAPTFTISNLSGKTTSAKFTKSAFTRAVVRVHGLSGKRIGTSLTPLRETLVSGFTDGSVVEGGDVPEVVVVSGVVVAQGVVVVELGLGRGHGQDEDNSLKSKWVEYKQSDHSDSKLIEMK